jgi:hypothetical protein
MMFIVQVQIFALIALCDMSAIEQREEVAHVEDGVAADARGGRATWKGPIPSPNPRL